MAATNTTIKIDPELKEQAQCLFEDLGINMSSAVNMFLKQAVREQAIPFRVGNPFLNAETVAALLEVEQMKVNPELGQTYTDVDEMIEVLLQ